MASSAMASLLGELELPDEMRTGSELSHHHLPGELAMCPESRGSLPTPIASPLVHCREEEDYDDSSVISTRMQNHLEGGDTPILSSFEALTQALFMALSNPNGTLKPKWIVLGSSGGLGSKRKSKNWVPLEEPWDTDMDVPLRLNVSEVFLNQPEALLYSFKNDSSDGMSSLSSSDSDRVNLESLSDSSGTRLTPPSSSLMESTLTSTSTAVRSTNTLKQLKKRRRKHGTTRVKSVTNRVIPRCQGPTYSILKSKGAVIDDSIDYSIYTDVTGVPFVSKKCELRFCLHDSSNDPEKAYSEKQSLL